jgi:two-component system chemotaxis response regulator CheB
MASPQQKKLRVLVVDDSAYMCKVLRDIINSDPHLEVAGQARDGRDAVALAESLSPDVITMDINMPHLDGLQATEMIMAHHPRPIVIVSSDARIGAANTLRALELGAIDFVTKPSSGIDLDMNAVREELTRKIKLAAKVRVIRTATRPKLSPSPASSSSAAAPGRAGSLGNHRASHLPVIVIAASTGGPAAVCKVVEKLPKDLQAWVFLVLHMPSTFTKQFVQQLAEAASLPVKEADMNEAPQRGVVYLCPGSHHLRLASSGRILLDSSQHISGYRPCADVTLESVSEFARASTIAVVLTGMGDDASIGVKAVKAAGGWVIAQDEATSTIFGMPAEAIKTGAVNEILPLDQISAAIEKRVLRLWRPAVAVTQ